MNSTDADIVRELARDAKSLRDDRAFKAATALLQRQWYGELISNGSDDEKRRDLVAKLQVLEAIPKMLDHLINDNKMLAQRGHRA
jgi:hypothetical protein